MLTADCTERGETMKLSVKPREESTELSKNERPTTIPYALDERRCPNGHRRDLTDTESRTFE